MVMAEQGGNSLMMRDYRKGNWTLTETMILIEAKKMDDDRRNKRTFTAAAENSGKPAEPRWKWVEDYCWRKSCFRSQNQCNDKWDNLMRDYKKVRDHERRRSGDELVASYWKMEKNERKDRNLPTNMVPEIYDALMEVVEKKAVPRSVLQAPPLGVTPADAVPAAYQNLDPAAVLTKDSMVTLPRCAPAPVPPPPPPPPPVTEPQLLLSNPSWPPAVEARGSSGSETNENYSDSSPAKRRRRSAATTATAAAASGSASPYEAVGAAISRSASMIADTLQACDQREERRHRDLLSVHERRLQMSESKAEISRHGVTGLVDAINRLADSIHALAASSSSSPSKQNQKP